MSEVQEIRRRIEQYLTWDDLLALSRTLLAADPGEVDRRWQAVAPGDALTVLYTSGTTGNPKGVVITHAMALRRIVHTKYADAIDSLYTA